MNNESGTPQTRAMPFRSALGPEALLRKRDWMFHSLILAPSEGEVVAFASRFLRSGRHVSGKFSLAQLDETGLILRSELTSDEHNHLIAPLIETLYPLAKRPFVSSAQLVTLLEQAAIDTGSTVEALETIGYHNETGDPRRDYKRQTLSSARQEMLEQGRDPHIFRVSFCSADSEIVFRINRHLRVVLENANLEWVEKHALRPGYAQAVSSDTNYKIVRSSPSDQHVLKMEYPPKSFETPEQLRTLCRSIAKVQGLSVSIIHLNPYLSARVLDILTGQSVHLIVSEEEQLLLSPSSLEASDALERTSTAIRRYFGEAEESRVAKLESKYSEAGP